MEGHSRHKILPNCMLFVQPVTQLTSFNMRNSLGYRFDVCIRYFRQRIHLIIDKIHQCMIM